MASDSEKALAKQGWIQTCVTVLGTCGLILWTFADVKAIANAALEKANEARTDGKALSVEVKEAKEELVEIKTILKERLPQKRD